MIQPVSCNFYRDICFTFCSDILSSFVPRTKHRDRAGGMTVFYFFINFFPPNDLFSVAPALPSKKDSENVSCYHTLPSFPLQPEVPHETKVSNHSTMIIKQQQQQQQQQRTDNYLLDQTYAILCIDYTNNVRGFFLGAEN